MKTSYISFVRKQLGLKGKTSHNGRGAYNCFVDESSNVTQEQLFALVEDKLAAWQAAGMIECVDRYENFINITFKSGLSSKDNSDYYRILGVNRKAQEYKYFNRVHVEKTQYSFGICFPSFLTEKYSKEESAKVDL